MTHVRSIDALINATPEAQPINPASSPANHAPMQKVEAEVPGDEPTIHVESPKQEPNLQENGKKDPETPEKSENSGKSDTNVDEYGNELPKPKMYTEEEVQKMIRDRLKRGAAAQREQQAQQPTQQQIQQAQNSGFEYDQNSEQTWEQQLETFIENTVQKLGEKQQRRAAEAHQQQVKQEFESKFMEGMSKYPDFVEVMQDKPISNDMMMGISGLENPAAFLYAAAKRAPGELERISKIQNPYQQVAEMGRLHEKLTKNKAVSKAPAPVSGDKSDINERSTPKNSIDHLIQQDAVARVRR